MKIVLMNLLGILMTSASYAAYGQTTPLTIVDLADGTKILADARGMTVYLFDLDVGITVRKDGTQQLTFNDKPIYFYVSDGAQGDINGDGLGGVWHIITK